jgi:peptidyl-prolyl cis-trans isomerase B (cyclophilin B)
VKAKAEVKAGKIDLSALFPILWKPDSDKPSLMYAQLVAGDKKVGSAVVLQPMTSFQYARWDPQEQWQFKFGDMQNPMYTGVRAYVDKYVVMDTSEGQITLAMRPDMAPNTCFNFLQLTEGGYYTNVPFHRIVPEVQGHPFVIQGGDPSGTGEGGPGYFIDLEQSDLPHDFGVISMARLPEANSAGSQFFICLSREGTLPLDGLYTTFGYATKGADTILKIAATKLENNKPVKPPMITSAHTVEAEPYNGAPVGVKRPEAPAPER